MEDEKQKLLKQINIQKNFVFYLQYLLDKTQKNRQKNRTVVSKKTGRVFFRMPTIMERFFDIEFAKYLILKDIYFSEFSDENIEDYLGKNRSFTIPTKFTSYRMNRYVVKNYENYFVLLYYFKAKYNVKITDKFLYLIYIATDLPPAVLAFMQLHTKKRFRSYRKIEINWEQFFQDNPQVKDAVERVENLLLRGKNGKNG
ncbi:hypothetical protein SAMN05660835_01868 [Desulfurella multipotens]|uniref:Uncharacterized protein n=1 Tax=Desulfurella multipotens TaxID=79269 RepID=A0A1G6RX77_9BACT|nr:hypothetical protein [Desulfurella multipotens]SDD09053.1 hypothetical protein SAMN05660835_01868 [Desulfurella multipotens]